MTGRLLHVLAVVFTALALVPSGTHFFELPAKIGLSQGEYFTVQQIYLGWQWFGVVLIAALVSDIALAVALRGEPVPFSLACVSSIAIALTLGIFFTWIFPANVATSNWSIAPANWQDLRMRWEYGHAVNAVITLAALTSVTLALALSRRAG